MKEAKKYLLDIGFDDAHLPLLFNDDDKSYYTIMELMHAYADHKLKLLGIADVSQQSELLNGYEIWKRLVNIRTENYTASTLIEMYLKTI
jgi:hypothetical protein